LHDGALHQDTLSAAMPGHAHEILILALREQPSLLSHLLSLLGGPVLPQPLSLQDTTLRLADVAEVRPDLLFTAGSDRVLVEVQHRVDPTKRRAWAKAVVALLETSSSLPDLLVLTHRAHVARWARKVVSWSTPRGTRLLLRPIVLFISSEEAEALVNTSDAGLMLVAVLAVQKKHGPRAVRIVKRALRGADRLPEPLQQVQTRAILQMLGDRLLEQVRKSSMDLSKIPESESFKRFKIAIAQEAEARGEARGKAEAIAKVLEARGLVVSEAHRKRLLGEQDTATLDRWLLASLSISRVTELWAPHRAPRKPSGSS
jgi:hypothetical protein